MTLEDCLRRNANLWPLRTAVTAAGQSCTYSQLLRRVELRAASIAEPGRIVPLRAAPTIGFLVDYLAIHAAGATAAPLDKNLPQPLMDQMERQVEGKTAPEGTADVLFTTGTTGKPKGVMISHRAIMANAQNLALAQQYSAGLTFIIAGPLNHIGSLSKIYPTLLVGASLHIVDGLRDVNALFAAIDDAPAKVATFLVPASVAMLLRFAKKQLAAAAHKIDFIETGAAPIPLANMTALCQTLPHSRLYNTYASTETGIIATFNFNSGECLQGCLGEPMRNSAIEISPEGKVVCSGSTIMTGYLDDDHATSQVLADGKIHTSDLGFIDPRGRLRLSGRADDVINVAGLKVSPAEVEEAALTMEQITDCVCVAVEHPLSGMSLKLLYVADSDLDKRAIALHLKARLESYKVPMLYQRVERVHRTFNGKIDRKKYTPQKPGGR